MNSKPHSNRTRFSQNPPLIPTQDSGLHFIAMLSNPYPNGIREPVGAAAGPQTFLGQSITFFNPDPLAPRMQRFQVGIERELPEGFFVEAPASGTAVQTLRLRKHERDAAEALEHQPDVRQNGAGLPSRNNFDLSLVKNTAITDQVHLLGKAPT